MTSVPAMSIPPSSLELLPCQLHLPRPRIRVVDPARLRLTAADRAAYRPFLEVLRGAERGVRGGIG